ncbi:MAG: endo-1,4-beta-xylanase [Kiritimatiellae bacterium]|nr:endo-1,4-beta-xylanase [Kiritimatiellia bacterium]
MTKTIIAAVALAAVRTAIAAAPERGVPAGCDPSVMSDGYWQVWNAAEQAKIDAAIEKNRKADAKISVAAPDGADVKVEQLDSDFRFGAHIFNFNQLGKKQYNDAYKASYGPGGIFNQATVAFYWKEYEPVPGRLRAGGGYEDTEHFWNSMTRDEAMDHPFWRRPAPAPVIDYLRSRGVTIHGHILVWGSAKPDWIYDWYCPENEKRFFDTLGIPRNDGSVTAKTRNWVGAYSIAWRNAWVKAYADKGFSEEKIAAAAPVFVERMRQLFRKRVFDVAGAFGEVVDSWDVVNESSHDWTVYRKSNTALPVWKSRYGLMPGDYPLNALLDAKEAFPEKTRLAINDYNICKDFLAQVRDLDAEGAKIDIVGCQMHLFNTNDCMRLAKGETNIGWVGTPKTISDRLDMMSQTGRPLHVSEITITSPGADERCRMIQAILTRNIYRAWFSHRATMGITWWNTVDGGAVKGEPLVSGLFTADLRKKPAYHALDELINREWKTRTSVKAAGGRVAFRGFRGRYRLSWKDSSGADRSVLAEVK